MKIDGIDPLLLNRIKEQTDRLEVRRAENVLTDSRVRREGDQGKFRRVYQEGMDQENRVYAALERLNDQAGRDNLPLSFRGRREADQWLIEIVDQERGDVVKVFSTGQDQVIGVVNRIQSLFGVLLDQKR